MTGVYKNSENGLLEFFKRELNIFHPRVFPRRISASQTLIEKIDFYGILTGHRGCVNTIEFNSTGELLVSGSDDRQVMLWDWAKQELKFSFPSGHLDNIFQAKIMPFSDDRQIVTSSADCQVMLSQLLENGSVETRRLSKHQGRVRKLAIEPGSPYIFYSCGEDAFVRHYDLRSNSSTKLFYCSSFAKNILNSCGPIRLNAIVIDPRNPNYLAVGGADAYARVYDIRKYQVNAGIEAGSPVNSFCGHHLIQKDGVHITALAYSNTSELLVSYKDELIYLFQKNMGFDQNPMSSASDRLHGLADAQVYLGHRNSQTVEGVNFFGRDDDYVVSGSDCGHLFIWKKKGGQLVRLMFGYTHFLNQLEPHPQTPVLANTCRIEKNINIWAPSSNAISPLPDNVQEIMEVNRRGREYKSRVTLTPDVLRRLSRAHNGPAQVYAERNHNRGDNESDEDDPLEPLDLLSSGDDPFQ